jgi:hypothetical protein
MPNILGSNTNLIRGRIPGMQYTINCTISIKIQESDLNINGLIKAVRDFSQYVLGKEFLEMTIQAMDQQHVEKIREASPDRFEHRGYQNRTLRTSVGPLNLRFIRLKDREANKSSCPGMKFLNCPSHVRWTDQVMTDAVGMVPFMSFQNSSNEYKEQHGYGPGKSTVHRRLEGLVGIGGDFKPYLKKRHFRYLQVDGTGARFQDRSDAAEDKFYAGEVRFAYASTGENQPFELVGLWIEKSWKDCAMELYSRMSTERLDVLISDGEEGILSAFLMPHMRPQRCHVHALRDLSYVLYGDGQKKAQQKEIFEELRKLPLIGCTQEDFEELTTESISTVKAARNRINMGLKELSAATIAKGFVKAGTYLRRLAEPFMTCLDYFIETGRIIPITSNIIERQIGLFKNRYNKVGRRWSEEGLARWFAIAIRKLLPQFDWKDCWKEILGSTEAVKLELQVCSIS